MSIEHNRLLLKFDEAIKSANKEIIDPAIPKLTMSELTPVIRMAAHARAAYLKELFQLAADSNDQIPSQDKIERLSERRKAYEEFLAGSQALETAIQRGYLEIEEDEA